MHCEQKLQTELRLHQETKAKLQTEAPFRECEIKQQQGSCAGFDQVSLSAFVCQGG